TTRQTLPPPEARQLLRLRCRSGSRAGAEGPRGHGHLRPPRWPRLGPRGRQGGETCRRRRRGSVLEVADMDMCFAHDRWRPTSRFCPWQPRRHSTLRRLRRQMVPTRPGHETSPPGCGAQRDVLRAAARHPTGLRLDHVRLAQDPDGAVTTERAPPPPLHSRSPGRRMPSRRFTCQLPVVVFLDFTVFMLHRSSAQAHVVHFVELLHCIWPSTQATIELHHFVHSQPY
ncbi:unnamed protein product, partial [Prorocentrum cordatum]